DFQRPMDGSLLWVYEGLTEHLGYLLPARAGLWTPEYYREQIAAIAATLDTETGRDWRPLGDTAVAAQMLYGTPRDGRARRRGVDFYDESVFLWLDVDTLLREHSKGKVTLDDFCHRFHGGKNSGPQWSSTPGTTWSRLSTTSFPTTGNRCSPRGWIASRRAWGCRAS